MQLQPYSDYALLSQFVFLSDQELHTCIYSVVQKRHHREWLRIQQQQQYQQLQRYSIHNRIQKHQFEG